MLDDDDDNGIKDATATLRPLRNSTDDDRDAPQSNRSGVLQTFSALFPGGIVGNVAAFVIDNTVLSACTRICRGGVGVVEAPIADTSLADGLFWPSPSSGICTTGVMHWRGGRTQIPLFLAISIALAMVRGGCFL